METALQKIRKHCDIEMTISISLNGVLIDFTKAEKVSALLYNVPQQTYCPIASSAKEGEATTLVCLADASSHCYNGVYKLVVRVTVDGTSVEYDIPAFNGVDSSLEMGDDYGSLKTIELTINAEKFTATTGVLQKLIDKMEAGEDERVAAEQTRQAQEQKRESNTKEAITGANKAAEGAINAAKEALAAAKKFAEAIVQQTGTAADKVMSQKAVTEICEALAKAIELKQEKLTAGRGINIEGGVISSTLDTNPFVVVSSLPVTGDSEKIYLVPAEKQEEGNLTDEWIWNNGQWERLGSAKVDLTAYAKTEDVETALEAKQDTISDLEAIRSGASKGATALQEESDPVYLKDKPSLALKSEIPDIVQETGDSVTAAMSQDAVTKEFAKKANTLHEHTISQITDMPAIPSKTSELANDSGYVTEPTVMAHTDAEVTITLTPNVIHHITGATAITVSSVTDTFKECFLQFVSGESAPTLTMPAAIKWAGGQAPTLEAGMTYQISVVKLCAVCVGYKEVTA